MIAEYYRDSHRIATTVGIRFKKGCPLENKDLFIMFEEGMATEEELAEEFKLQNVNFSFVPRYLIDAVASSGYVPISVSEDASEVYLGYAPGSRLLKEPLLVDIVPIYIEVPIYQFLPWYEQYYGEHPELLPVPIKDKYEFIISEAVALDAIDITISDGAMSSEIFYNVRKSLVRSKRPVTRHTVENLVRYICVKAEEPFIESERKPVYISLRLDNRHRGRVVINRTNDGFSVTIRVLPDGIFNMKIDDLNLSKETQSFIISNCMNQEKGMRLLVGETMSGKNTTILSILATQGIKGNKKIVSVENPVEHVVPGIIQLNSSDDVIFEAQVQSLIRQNPDIVYVTELTDFTAQETLKVANTGKIVYSTVHASSAPAAIPRLMDLTGWSLDKIIMNVHSIIYQELIRDEARDSISPINRCVYLTPQLKYKLYGKELHEVLSILAGVEVG